MKYFDIRIAIVCLILLLPVAFIFSATGGEPTTATIVNISDKRGTSYLKDEHGHMGRIPGIWGSKGDILKVTCKNGRLRLIKTQ